VSAPGKVHCLHDPFGLQDNLRIDGRRNTSR
jgi:hypothetical protein